jgi:hypothetical protein
MKNKIIKIIKVPLPPEEKATLNRQQVFPRMPRLYLELLENKVKIKQDLVNKDYVPNVSSQKPSLYNEPPQNFYKKDEKEDKYKDDKYKDDKYEDDKYDKYKDDKYEDDKYKDDKYKDDKDKYEDKYKDDKDKYEDKYKDDKDKYDDKYKDDKYEDKYKDDKDKYDDKYKDDKDKYEDKYKSSELDNYVSSTKDDYKPASPSSNISDRLQELLKDDPAEPSKRSYEDKYSKHRDFNYRSVEQYKRSIDGGDNELPPTLSELEKQGGVIRKKELRDINNISVEEQYDEDAKRELMFKMDLLRKSYPNSIIPEYSIHSDYNSMKRAYESTVRRLSLDSSVESYKTYLIGGFMICEFVLGNYLGFDMVGFTQQQILTINSYEVLLIELGEKSYIPGGSKWPVEIRLLFMILCNAGLFIVSKMIMKQTGSNLLGLINNMNRGNVNNTANASNSNAKRKMKEPSINVDDLPEIPI